MKNNILLVDDDEITNFISIKILKGVGFTEGIHTARNGKEALKFINDFFLRTGSLPDIIFLDLDMPVMNGFGFIDAFKNLSIPGKESVLIVIVTSSQDPGDNERAKELGIIHYLTKPISENSIHSVLELIHKMEISKIE